MTPEHTMCINHAYKGESNLNIKKYAICEAPICVGSPTQGTENAFKHLKKNGLEALFKSRADFIPMQGELTAPALLKDPNLNEIETVMLVNRKLFDTLRQEFEKGSFPITIGGDHSIAISTIAALSESVGTDNTAVVYVDGHPDINTEKTTLSGNIHGMPLAVSMGLCTDKLNIGSRKVHLKGENTYIVGARSIDDAEYKIIEEQNVTMRTKDDVDRIGYKSITKDIAERFKGKAVHICFDVDSIDGKEFPSTGYVMPNGLSYETVRNIISDLLKSCDVRSFECVEYNPSLDKNGSDLNKLLDIFRLFK